MPAPRAASSKQAHGSRSIFGAPHSQDRLESKSKDRVLVDVPILKCPFRRPASKCTDTGVEVVEFTNFALEMLENTGANRASKTLQHRVNAGGSALAFLKR